MTRERLIPLTLAASALLAVTACSSDGTTSAPDDSGASTTTATPSTSPGTTSPGDGGPVARPQGFGPAQLDFFGDCAALLDYMQTEASERVTAWGLGGGPYYYETLDAEMAVADMDTDEAGGDGRTASAPSQATDNSYSGTNTQEIGVDEGDIVETDGEHVYVASNDGVRIVAVGAAEEVATLELPNGSHQLLLTGDRLLVTTSSWSGSADTVVSLYDVADASNPNLLRRSHLEGATVATRSIDGVARLVITTSFDQRLPFVHPDQFGLDEDSALARNQEIIAESSVEDWLPRAFDENGDGSFGPMRPILACEDVAAPGDFAGLGLTWISSIDALGDGEPVGSAGVVSTGTTVYASTDNLYIATQNWDWQWGGPVPMPVDVVAEGAEGSAVDPAVDDAVDEARAESSDQLEVVPENTLRPPEPSVPETTEVTDTTPETTEATDTTEVPDTTDVPETTEVTETTPETTEVTETTEVPDTTVPELDPNDGPPTLIHQFSLGSGTEASYVASGMVSGRLLNQFAMSEHNGDLRVATTNDDWGGFGDQSDSTVYVLRPNGTTLEQISSIGGLGKGEQIYAVRFMGDVGYVVTFRQIDPLYVLDLSDPENPELDGELKIPGYSAYLHPVGEGLLLGVGQDATLEGRTTGTKLTLFDVSDPANPREVSSLPIGGHSEVEWDHKAFLFWEPDGTIVLPVSPGWNDCGPADTCLAKELTGAGGGAVVVQLDGDQLSSRGVISHGRPNQRGCWNPLQRSMVIDDEIVTVGLDQLQFTDRASLEPRAAVTWGDAEEYGCYWYID